MTFRYCHSIPSYKMDNKLGFIVEQYSYLLNLLKLQKCSLQTVSQSFLFPTGTIGPTFSFDSYFHLFGSVLTLCPLCSPSRGQWYMLYSVAVCVCVWVFPGSGSGSAAFRGLNTRTMCYLGVLGVCACWGSGVGSKGPF